MGAIRLQKKHCGFIRIHKLITGVLKKRITGLSAERIMQHI
jgi:hypothetical protein